MVSEGRVKNDKNLGISFFPHCVWSLPMVSEGLVKNDKNLGISFLAVQDSSIGDLVTY